MDLFAEPTLRVKASFSSQSVVTSTIPGSRTASPAEGEEGEGKATHTRAGEAVTPTHTGEGGLTAGEVAVALA